MKNSIYIEDFIDKFKIKIYNFRWLSHEEPIKVLFKEIEIKLPSDIETVLIETEK